ncbi:MAG: GntR family transcriptional regulator [Anaerolineae bacterium]|nr:GntR family transcriptional regulator [Anaerolineae bacterium]
MSLPNVPGVPLYVQIREALREEIEDGQFVPGQQIPPEEELASHYGVSRMTLRRAITDLIDEGFIYRRHGVGTFISHLQVNRDHTRLTDFLEGAKASGLEARVEVLKKEVVPANHQVAKALALDEGVEVLHITTLRIVNDQPVTLHNSYVPRALLGLLSEDKLAVSSPWLLLENRGMKIKDALERLEARGADEEQAAILAMEQDDPILYKERIVFAEDGMPVEFEVCYNRGDKYSCSIILRR